MTQPPNAAALASDFNEYQKARQNFWDRRYEKRWSAPSHAYHQRLLEVYRLNIPADARVIELGCGNGDLLAALRPSYGVGIDFSSARIDSARLRHPELHLYAQDIHDFRIPNETFDFVILSDIINDVWDLQTVLENVCRVCHPRTRLIFNFFSHLWQLPLALARRLGLATPTLRQNWFTRHDVDSLLELTGFETLREWQEFVVPVPLFGLERPLNRFLARVLPFRWLALTNFMVARRQAVSADSPPRVSVVVAARNEEGHIAELVHRIPEMGGGTEIIFVEGNSRDDTWGAIERVIADSPQRDCKLLKQPGSGKGDAVRTGFAAAKGEILMILDADMTVPPEDLVRFFNVMTSGRGDFVNGVRLVYPMQEEAMRFMNLVGNKFFSAAFSWMLGQPIRDTLCGTKVLWAKDYAELARNRHYFGDFDPFGDFDLLFGAAKMNLKIAEIPVRYRARRYGETNIQRWRHGVLLLRMVFFAARRIKFV